MRIAAVLTAYSRREKTLACLAALRSQQLPPNVSLQVFLTDDASPDGTGSAVGSEFPEVIVLAGTGSLFWAGGMRLAFGEALRHEVDFRGGFTSELNVLLLREEIPARFHVARLCERADRNEQENK